MNLATEIRAKGHLESLEESDSGGFSFRGYATMFDSDYTITDELGEYTERIASGAFTRTLNAGADVRLLLNHDGLPLARTRSGTLTLEQDDTGLLCRADLDPASTLVRDIQSAMNRGDLDQMSFAFKVTRQEWNEDYTDRTIREAQLFDVSVVTYPANPATVADMRSAVVARHGVQAWDEMRRDLLTRDDAPALDAVDAEALERARLILRAQLASA